MADNIRIENVSDTALWVATYRAEESKRPDALFQDPLAAKLAGERGYKIAELMGAQEIMAWIMSVRTVAIDRLIIDSIKLGVDCVVNIGAGLDTRPYRMDLPKNFNWIELDFPHMIDYKNDQLKNNTPVCNLQRIAVDLSNDKMSKEAFATVGATCKNALIITEGVIHYLSNEEATQLANNLHAIKSFQYWIHDYRNNEYKRRSPKSFKTQMKDAPMKFDAEDWVGFFEKLGWSPFENISAVEEGIRVGRPFPIPFPFNIVMKILPEFINKAPRERMRKGFGYVLFKKS